MMASGVSYVQLVLAWMPVCYSSIHHTVSVHILGKDRPVSPARNVFFPLAKMMLFEELIFKEIS